jgi:predicted transcriptional regulator
MNRKRNDKGQFIDGHNKKDLLKYIVDNNIYTLREIEHKVLWKRTTVKKYMDQLVDDGVLKRKKTEHSYVYWKKK